MRYMMTIANIFHFQDGRTVFIGHIVDGPPRIGPGECVLWVGDEPVARIQVEGEMMPLRRDVADVNVTKLRPISTLAELDPQLLSALRQDGKIEVLDRTTSEGVGFPGSAIADGTTK